MSSELAVRGPLAADRGSVRSIYVFTAALFIVVTVVGFLPTSLGLIADVRSGARPSPPLVLHAHALLMWAWLLMLLAQTALVSTGRRALHRVLGIFSLLLAPAVLATMVLVTFWSYWRLTDLGYPDFASRLLPVQIQEFVLFASLYSWAVLTRRTAPETHKRLMVLATLALLISATGRMHWLPGNIQPNQSYDLAPIYPLLLIVPALIHDWQRFRRVHRAYAIGLGLFVATSVAIRALWDSPWWLEITPSLMR